MVHLHFFPYNGVAYYHLYGISFLDEYEAIYTDEQKKPAEMAVI